MLSPFLHTQSFPSQNRVCTGSEEEITHLDTSSTKYLVLRGPSTKQNPFSRHGSFRETSNIGPPEVGPPQSRYPSTESTTTVQEVQSSILELNTTSVHHTYNMQQTYYTTFKTIQVSIYMPKHGMQGVIGKVLKRTSILQRHIYIPHVLR